MKQTFITGMVFAGILLFLSLFSVFVESADIPELKEDKGLIVFYRENKFSGGAIKFNLHHDGKPIGALKNGTMMTLFLEPGDHTFSSKVISEDSLRIAVEAGKIYYVEGTVQMGIFAGRPHLASVSESKAKKALKKIK